MWLEEINIWKDDQSQALKILRKAIIKSRRERSLFASYCKGKTWEWGNEAVGRGAEAENCHGIAWTVYTIQARGRETEQEEEVNHIIPPLDLSTMLCVCVHNCGNWCLSFTYIFIGKRRIHWNQSTPCQLISCSLTIGEQHFWQRTRKLWR